MRRGGRIIGNTTIKRYSPLARSTKPIARSSIKRRSTTMGEAKRMSRRTTTPEKKADIAFSKALRFERRHCQDDRVGHVCKGRLELAHGHERWHRATRYDERQCWVLCQGAHFWYGMHPLIWDEFMRRKMGKRVYEIVRELALNKLGRVRHDYTALIAEYTQRWKKAEQRYGPLRSR